MRVAAQSPFMDTVSHMNQMYRYQRHIYDFTRKYYLLGRDTLIQEMQVQAGDRILEMGCGTARNLEKLAAKHTNVELYGIDASSEMLATAEQKLRDKAYAHRIHLKQALAEEVHYQKLFDLDKPFDTVFYSYALSMIPPWREALAQGLANLKDGGDLYIVDFSQQAELPAWFRAVLRRWLTLFDVHPNPQLAAHLQQLASSGVVDCHWTSLKKDYAFIAHLKKKGNA